MFRVTLILLLLLFFFKGDAQTYFNKKYDLGGFPDESSSIITISSGYVICANGYHSSIGNLGVCLMFLDLNGDTTNTKWIVKENYGYYDGWGGGFRKYSKGGFYLGGTIQDSTSTFYGLLYLFDQSGDTLWTRKYGNGTDFYAIYHARETADKGFILTGSRDVGLNAQGFLIKTDSLGNIQWQQNYGGNGREFGTSVLPLNDGRYILGGSTETFPCGAVNENNLWLVRANSNGSQNWSNCYGGPNEADGGAYPAFEFSNGDIAVVGAYADPYPYLMRINSSGSIMNSDYIKYPILGYSGSLVTAIEGNNQDILAVGDYREGKFYGLFVRYDANIDSTWHRTYSYYYPSGSFTNSLNDIDTAHGGGYVMCGTTNQSSVQDVWVIKVDDHGCLFDPGCWLPEAYEEEKYSVGISEMEKENYFSVFPNPSNGKFYIESKIGIKSDLEIKIYNSLGEILFTTKFKNEIDLTSFSNGIYFIEVNTDEIKWRGKIVKV